MHHGILACFSSDAWEFERLNDGDEEGGNGQESRREGKELGIGTMRAVVIARGGVVILVTSAAVLVGTSWSVRTIAGASWLPAAVGTWFPVLPAVLMAVLTLKFCLVSRRHRVGLRFGHAGKLDPDRIGNRVLGVVWPEDVLRPNLVVS